MKRKEVKTLKLDDLESAQKSLKVQDPIEEVVEVKVNIKDLGTGTTRQNNADEQFVNFGFKVKKLQSKELFRNYQGDQSKKSILHFLTHKHHIDKKEFIIFHVIIFIFALFILITMKTYPEKASILIDNFYSSHGTVPLAFLLSVYNKIYPIFLILIVYFFPLKKNSKAKIEVYFDGMTVPVELTNQMSSKRVRLKWSQIQNIDYKRNFNIPRVQLYGDKNELLGEIRLDLTHLPNFQKALETYCPAENPLRKLLSNMQDS